MRAWLELPPGTGWADVRLAITRLEADGYRCEEVRGGDAVYLRLSGVRLEPGELWVMPPG